MTENLYEELKALVGKEINPITGIDDVCKQMIRHWCEAMEDANPMYTNEEYAKKSKYGSIVAPPTMVQAWSFGPLWPNGQDLFYRHPERLQKKESTPPEIAMQKLEKAGFIGSLATNTSMDFFKPLFPGDTVIQKAQLSDITPEKKTSAGIGHFIIMTYTYTNQKGELICRESFTFFKFKPAQAK
jgi:acyl dehydratase